MQKLSEVERLVSELQRREKVLHVLVNNAGATWGESIDDYPVSGQYIRARMHTPVMLDNLSGFVSFRGC